jgi:dTDP-4-amino-4,6-dideoxygalactose transaminase
VTELALFGGPPVRRAPFPRERSIGVDERAAVLAVLESDVLSRFLGEPGEAFLGGTEVRALEEAFARAFEAPHAVSTNSATTALQTALAAVGIEPGDEVIVSPYTMSASAATIVAVSAIPVFADIHPNTYCLDPASVRERLTPQTRGIMAVDIFGQPAHWDALNAMAREHGLAVVEDAAQAAGATYRGRPAGTLGDAGVLSLNYHKIIHSGEGGIILTSDPRVARRAQLIRNHGEAVLDTASVPEIAGIVGSNFRMTEIEAAIARTQLAKLPARFAHRSSLCIYLAERLRGLPGVFPPTLDEGATSTFYGFAVRLDPLALGVRRSTFVTALAAEGIPFGEGYVRPLYLQPMYQQRIAHGTKGHPWTSGHYAGTVGYEPGICPVAERMHFAELIVGDFGTFPQTTDDMDDVVEGFEKVIGGLYLLRGYERNETATAHADRRA